MTYLVMAFIAEAIGGFVGGLVAGLVGYIEGAVDGALFQAFGSIIPVIAVIGLIYAAISFFIGVTKAIFAGIFFCLGIIVAGIALQDWMTTVGGFIAIVGLIVSFIL